MDGGVAVTAGEARPSDEGAMQVLREDPAIEAGLAVFYAAHRRGVSAAEGLRLANMVMSDIALLQWKAETVRGDGS